MAALAPEYCLEPTNNLYVNGRRVRGYMVIYALIP